MVKLLKNTWRGGKAFGFPLRVEGEIRDLVVNQQREAAAKALPRTLPGGFYADALKQAVTHVVFTEEKMKAMKLWGRKTTPEKIVRAQFVSLPKHAGRVVKVPFGAVHYPITEKPAPGPKGKVIERPRR